MRGDQLCAPPKQQPIGSGYPFQDDDREEGEHKGISITRAEVVQSGKAPENTTSTHDHPR